ncbi:hypothetical protein [Streptomyces sp. 2224.1]|uniref:hypothetical protein n=1 Tax=Streptomyces sp. 2224.1 TaxID=1881020 RepID=UPI0035236A13
MMRHLEPGSIDLLDVGGDILAQTATKPSTATSSPAPSLPPRICTRPSSTAARSAASPKSTTNATSPVGSPAAARSSTGPRSGTSRPEPRRLFRVCDASSARRAAPTAGAGLLRRPG